MSLQMSTKMIFKCRNTSVGPKAKTKTKVKDEPHETMTECADRAHGIAGYHQQGYGSGDPSETMDGICEERQRLTNKNVK
jgi:hypothetical protein